MFSEFDCSGFQQ